MKTKLADKALLYSKKFFILGYVFFSIGTSLFIFLAKHFHFIPFKDTVYNAPLSPIPFFLVYLLWAGIPSVFFVLSYICDYPTFRSSPSDDKLRDYFDLRGMLVIAFILIILLGIGLFIHLLIFVIAVALILGCIPSTYMPG